MELEDALFAWAKTQAGIVANIGVPGGRLRFFKLKVPQGEKFPASVMQRSGTEEQALQCGPDGAVRIALQVDHYGKTWETMAATAKEFRRALRGDVVPFPIIMGLGGDESPSAFVKVKQATLENQFDLDDPDPGLFRRTQLWTFWVWEP